jgi:hypothetical protein
MVRMIVRAGSGAARAAAAGDTEASEAGAIAVGVGPGPTLAGAVIGGAIASNAYGIMVVRITVARITRATAILRAASSRRTIMYRPPAIMFRLTGPTTTDIRGGLGATGKSSDLTPSLTTRSDRLERAPQADLRGTKIVLCAVRTRPRSRYPRLSPLVLAGCSRRHLFAD